MPKPMPNVPPGFDELSIDEQIEYVQTLWDRVTADPEKVPLPAWHKEIIQKRIAELESDPEGAAPWEDVREEIAGRLRKE
jgi:putative addiction module component (TIGR02574 family)